MTTTAEKQKAALEVLLACSETIRELGSVPAGHLYAALMTKGCDIQQFEAIVGTLKSADLIRKEGDLLVWCGPVRGTARVKTSLESATAAIDALAGGKGTTR